MTKIKSDVYLVGFYELSAFVGYSLPNPFLYKLRVLFQTIQFSIHTHITKICGTITKDKVGTLLLPKLNIALVYIYIYTYICREYFLGKCYIFIFFVIEFQYCRTYI